MKCSEINKGDCNISMEVLEEGDFGTIYRCPRCYKTELEGNNSNWVLNFNLIFLLLSFIFSIGLVAIVIFKSEWLGL